MRYLKQKKSTAKILIELFTIAIIIIFVYACYTVEPLKNNHYVKIAKEKIGVLTNTTKDSLSALVENYEPDEEDDTVYEITDTQNRYYYNQLDDNSKIIYAEITENIDKIKAGEDNIKISSKLSSLATSSKDMSSALMSAFQNAWDAYRNDNVDVFYIDGEKMCLVTKTTTIGTKVSYEFYISRGNNDDYLIDGFTSSSQVDQAIQYVNDQEQQILSNITDKNDYYKIMKAHNWIVENIEYNMDESTNNANIYGALKDRKVVCEGYARLFKSLMDKLDVPCILVSGDGINEDTGEKENHAWDYVYLKGSWYAIDATWDDPVILGQGEISQDLKYKYFLKGSDFFNKSHVADGKLVQNGMEFIYPDISKEDYVKASEN